MKRVVYRTLPDKSFRLVQPFHVSLEGLKTAIICRDEKDYDAVEKILCICSKRKNVLIIIYTIVSNHAHIGVLSEKQQDADAYAREIKRMIGMWVRSRYGEGRLMKGMDAKALWLDNDWYVRNALAYIPRNILDNGGNINEYRWSGYGAMFHGKEQFQNPSFRKVSSLNKREKATLLHTCDNLDDVPWLIDGDGYLVPSSFCDNEYLEQVFEGDQSYFLRMIGGVNAAEMHQKLIESPRAMVPDSECYKTMNDISVRWFKMPLPELPLEKKIRIIPYVYRTMRTSVPQMARVFGLDRNQIAAILK